MVRVIIARLPSLSARLLDSVSSSGRLRVKLFSSDGEDERDHEVIYLEKVTVCCVDDGAPKMSNRREKQIIFGESFDS